MPLIPLFVHSALSADSGVEATALSKRLSAFNWCNPFDHVLPFADGSISASDRAHLWGMYSGIAIPGISASGGMLAAKHVRQRMRRGRR